MTYLLKVDLVSGSEDEGKVTGKLVMVQRFPESGGGVLITGRIDGLRAGRHGFHVHKKGELGNACKDAGGHFNPYEVKRQRHRTYLLKSFRFRKV